MKRFIALLAAVLPLTLSTKEASMGEHKILVAYFSATGTTEGIARSIAEGCGGSLCEIKPVKPYTDADLNWHDKKNRTTIECNDKSFRCPMQPLDANIADYDTILVGFLIWWYGAPSIIQTFLESANFKGKRIALFCTSGDSSLGNTQNVLKKSATGATWLGDKGFQSATQKMPRRGRSKL